MAPAVFLLRGLRQPLVRIAAEESRGRRLNPDCLPRCFSLLQLYGWPGREAGVTHRLCVAGDGYVQAEAVCRPVAGKGVWI